MAPTVSVRLTMARAMAPLLPSAATNLSFCQAALAAVQVVFVATANQLQNMSGPLLDRLEIIQLSGYTLEEKRHIAQVSFVCLMHDC